MNYFLDLVLRGEGKGFKTQYDSVGVRMMSRKIKIKTVEESSPLCTNHCLDDTSMVSSSKRVTWENLTVQLTPFILHISFRTFSNKVTKIIHLYRY